jgi:hypothetical protein
MEKVKLLAHVQSNQGVDLEDLSPHYEADERAKLATMEKGSKLGKRAGVFGGMHGEKRQK